MADISKILVDGTEYNIKDTTARQGGGSADPVIFDFLIGKTVKFNANGSITHTYDDGRYILQDFPTNAITRERLYSSDKKLVATKTTKASATGDIVETVVTA